MDLNQDDNRSINAGDMPQKQERFIEDIRDVKIQFTTKVFDCPNPNEGSPYHDEIPTDLIK